jgi:phage terminase large subunit GpA-like protein
MSLKKKKLKLPGVMRGIFCRPEIRSVTEWADKHRILPLTSAEPGRWRTDRTPYLKGIMDAFTDISVRDITIMTSSQVGKTEALLNMLGYAIDQDPSPAFFVMPREIDASDLSKDRLIPMVTLSPILGNHLTEAEDDLTKRKLVFDRMILYLGWANSPAGLASKSIRYLFMDEVDKYPPFSGKEADPVKLATERTRTFWNRKIIKCSTPTTEKGYIFREYQKSDKCKYYVPCPHCGEYQILINEQIKFPKDKRDPNEIKEKNLAWYECMKCNGRIDDQAKIRMLEHGVWLPEGRSIDKTGKITGLVEETERKGFWLNCIYSPWLTFSEIAAEFLSSQEKVETIMNFVNSWLAEVWEEKSEVVEKKHIELTITDYEESIVPDPVQVLTAGVDVQKGHLFYMIRGWGYREENWLIKRGRVESLDEIEKEVLNAEYFFATRPGKIGVRLVCVDSGYEPDDVYKFCRKHFERARPTKGKDTLGGIPYKLSTIDRTIDGEVIREGIKLWLLDTTYFKDKLTRSIQSMKYGKQYFHTFKDVGDEYCKQMSNEHKIIIRDRRKQHAHEAWVKKTTGSPNHFWDCEVLAFAAANMLHVSVLPENAPPAPAAAAQTNDKEDNNKSWIKTNRTNWISRR